MLVLLSLGKYAYVTIPRDGLHIIDVSEPLSPTQVAFYEVEGATDVTLKDQYAYVSSSSAGLHILDVSQLPQITQTSVITFSDRIWGLTSYENYLYVAGDNRGLHIIDVSNPWAPQTAGIFEASYYYAVDIIISNGIGIIISNNYGPLRTSIEMIDLTSPTNPIKIADYETDGTAKAVTMDDEFIYVANV